MKTTIKLAVVAALALGATSAFATNGSVMIGVGAKSRGMGGVGIATGFGAESGYNNPALITSIKGDNEISFGGTLFMPDIEVTNTLPDGLGNPVTNKEDSDADMFVIPSVSVASKINDNWYWGLGMWGTGGLGTDFRDTDAYNPAGNTADDNTPTANATTGTHMQMVTALQLMQFGVPVAYTSNNFSVGITPIVQYSSLDIDYSFASKPNPMAAMGAGNMPRPFSAGSGVADDIAFGFNLGMAYEISGFTVGAMYKSEITFDIDDVLTNSMAPMTNPMFGSYTEDEMSTPEQYGLGVSYTMSGHTLALDWKYINWEDAEVYKDFGWKDQDVIAVGYEYNAGDWAVRCGYQYAESAVESQDTAFGAGGAVDPDGNPIDMTFDSNGINGSTKNTLNLMGFPGTQETHITLGGSYAFNETLSMDLAAVFGLENEESYTNFAGQEIETKHVENSFSVQLNYAF